MRCRSSRRVAARSRWLGGLVSPSVLSRRNLHHSCRASLRKSKRFTEEAYNVLLARRAYHTHPMSSYAPGEGGSQQPSTPTLSNPPTNGKSSQAKGGLVPTNNVTTKEGMTVRTRIEPSLAVEDVIRQLCISLKLKDPPAVYALRDENDELVTNDNLRKKIKGKVNLK